MRKDPEAAFSVMSPFPGQLPVNDSYNLQDCLPLNILYTIR